jgi:septal ring-binding cell division protein DamX
MAKKAVAANELPAPAAISSKTTTKTSKPVVSSGAHYTIELFTSRSAEHAQAFIDANNLKGKARYIVIKNKAGLLRYQVVYGDYVSLAAAQTALKQLPLNLQKFHPLIKKITK